VSFVSVTQQFNTTSSMGRLTLNVLLSFAQFEREVTGERIRDKIAASARTARATTNTCLTRAGRVPEPALITIRVSLTWEEGSHLKEYTYTKTGGTGKYQGVKGGGTYMYQSLTDTLSGGRYKGTIQLP
jgi:hypothetical protein